MGSGGHNRKTAKELAAAATLRDDRMPEGAGSEHLASLLDAWVEVGRAAVREIADSGQITIENAGGQLQKHPAVTVLETASKRVEALVVLVGRVDPPSADLPESGVPRISVVE